MRQAVVLERDGHFFGDEFLLGRARGAEPRRMHRDQRGGQWCVVVVIADAAIATALRVTRQCAGPAHAADSPPPAAGASSPRPTGVIRAIQRPSSSTCSRTQPGPCSSPTRASLISV